MDTKIRKKCLLYIQKNLDQWPMPHSTWHTGACHYGYSWCQDIHHEWILKSKDNDSDIITKECYEATIPDDPKPTKIWVKFDNQCQIKQTTTTKPDIENEWIEFNSIPLEENIINT